MPAQDAYSALLEARKKAHMTKALALAAASVTCFLLGLLTPIYGIWFVVTVVVMTALVSGVFTHASAQVVLADRRYRRLVRLNNR